MKGMGQFAWRNWGKSRTLQ